MPHLTLEYTANLTAFEAPAALSAANEAMFDSGLFGESDIKSRAIVLDCYQVGVLPVERAFVHARIALLAGRNDEDRRQLAEAVVAALRPWVMVDKGREVQISVETVDLDRASYAKAVLHG